MGFISREICSLSFLSNFASLCYFGGNEQNMDIECWMLDGYLRPENSRAPSGANNCVPLVPMFTFCTLQPLPLHLLIDPKFNYKILFYPMSKYLLVVELLTFELLVLMFTCLCSPALMTHPNDQTLYSKHFLFITRGQNSHLLLIYKCLYLLYQCSLFVHPPPPDP